MSRQPVLLRLDCAESGCREVRHYHYDTQRDRREAQQRYARHPWRCTRHATPDEVLTTDAPERVHVLVATKVPSLRLDEFLPGLFWRREGAEGGGSGFTFGPGFRAFADDFPEGTRLVITSRVELPDTHGGQP